MPDLSVSILLSQAFSNIVLACLLEPLRVVRDSTDADIRWSILTVTDAPVLSSSGIRVEPDAPVRQASPSDLVLIIGGDNFREESLHRTLSPHVRPLLRSGVVIGADTGAWLLAALGLLDGRKATIHWQLHAEFAETFLRVDASADRFVRDGRFWSCGSAATALDLILLFIEDRFGPAVAYDASAMFLQEGPQAAAPTPELPRFRERGSPTIAALVSRMADTLETPLPLSELAASANMSERSLSRLFKRELGVAPGRYYQVLRLSRAQDLMTHTRLSVEEVALRCGFASASGLRKAFRKQYGAALRAERAGR